MEDTIIAGEPGALPTSEEAEQVIIHAGQRGSGFQYLDASGNCIGPVTDEAEVAALEGVLDSARDYLAECLNGHPPTKPPKTRRPDLSPFSSRSRR